MTRKLEWGILMRSTYGSLYFSEMFFLADEIVKVCGDVFDSYPPPQDPGKSYWKVDPEAHARIRRVLGAAARLRSLVRVKIPRGLTEEVRELQQARSAWLHNEILRGMDVSAIDNVEVRNSLEHFDERLDKVAIKHFGLQDTMPRIALVDMAVGNRAIIEQLVARRVARRDYEAGEVPQVLPIRLYIADERIFLNLGSVVDLLKIREQCSRIRESLRPIMQDRDGNAPEEGQVGQIIFFPKKMFTD